MNKHFEDSLYYLRRATEHAKLGVEETLEPIERRVRERVGSESVPEPTPVDALFEDVKVAERKARVEASGAVGAAKARLEGVRSR